WSMGSFVLPHTPQDNGHHCGDIQGKQERFHKPTSPRRVLRRPSRSYRREATFNVAGRKRGVGAREIAVKDQDRQVRRRRLAEETEDAPIQCCCVRFDPSHKAASAWLTMYRYLPELSAGIRSTMLTCTSTSAPSRRRKPAWMLATDPA